MSKFKIFLTEKVLLNSKTKEEKTLQFNESVNLEKGLKDQKQLKKSRVFPVRVGPTNAKCFTFGHDLLPLLSAVRSIKHNTVGNYVYCVSVLCNGATMELCCQSVSSLS